MRDGASVAAFVAVLTALTYFVFPGHTYLQQDTQIYLPMLEKLENPALFARELLTSRPHLAWNIYDETALALRRLTGFSFENILSGEQLLFRAFGIWGVFLIGTSLGFTRRLSMFITALFSLGAMIVGPQVLTIEYEPVPRGFALPMVLCAMGLALERRRMAASMIATFALMYHAPTTAAFWLVFAVLLWRSRDWKPALFPAVGLALLFAFSRWQPGVSIQQPMFAKISPALAELQRMRAAYNWVTLWPIETWVHYAVMTLLCIVALRRLRPRLSVEHRIVFLGLIGIAILSVPFSWVTLEGFRWALIPQFQPARKVLFITALGVILTAAAGIQAAYEQHYSESFAWLLIPFIIPVHKLVTPPYMVKDAVLIVGLAAAAAAAVAVHVVAPRRAAAALAMASLVAYFAVPLVGDVHNYPALWNAEIVKLSQWARASSASDAVFLFPRSGKDLHPGIFRAEAQRAVYVDWKGGGQVNYFEDLALEWWNRWQGTVLRSATDGELAKRGVDYVVVELKDVRQGVSPVYSNAVYAVYRVR